MIRVEYMRLDELAGRLMPGNPKDHDLGAIAKSIEEHGFIAMPVVNEGDGKVIAGNGRVQALVELRRLGRGVPENIRVGDGGEWLVPVQRGVEFGSAAEAAAYLIADNRMTELGGWHREQLAQMLLELERQDLLDGTGFSSEELEAMLRELDMLAGEGKDEGDDEEELDEAEVLLAKYGVEAGQVWRVGSGYIVCGDSTDRGVWSALVAAAGVNRLDAVFTSPPYAQQRAKRSEWYGGIAEEEYVSWWRSVQASAREFLRSDGQLFLNIKPHVVDGARVLYVMDLVIDMVRVNGWHLIDEFCWTRTGAPGSWPNRFKNGFEPVYQFGLDTKIEFYPDNVADYASSGVSVHGGNRSTGNYYNMEDKVFEWDSALPSNCLPTFGNATGTGHPAAFPPGLPEFFMLAFSRPGSIWMDPFAGSGTLGVAAIRNDRVPLMVELLPKFVAVTLERIANLTGDEPERIG